MVLFIGLAIALETVMHSPFKLPGHRALPGVFALLLFAQAFPTAFILAFATAMPILFLLLGVATSPYILMVWIVPALLLTAIQHERVRDSLLFFLGVGLLFGALRFLSLMGGFHKTPQLIRLGGHLFFGGIGSLAAFYMISRTGLQRFVSRRLP